MTADKVMHPWQPLCNADAHALPPSCRIVKGTRISIAKVYTSGDAFTECSSTKIQSAVSLPRLEAQAEKKARQKERERERKKLAAQSKAESDAQARAAAEAEIETAAAEAAALSVR